jgi:predicted MPP superfamily phosphohydrolase
MGTVACAQGQDTWDLRLTRWRVPLPDLPKSLHGLTIAHLSDFHVGPDVRAEFVAEALRLAMHHKPDLIALTGDYISHDWRNLARIQRDLAALSAPLGVYACLGNHDSFCDRARFIRAGLTEAGIRVLSNEAEPLKGHEGAWIVGLADPCTGRHDFDRALRHVPSGAFRLMLAHTPEVVDAAAQLGVQLLLTGHTHGGQVNLPLIGPPVVPTRYGPRYAWGLFARGATRLVVNRGVGVVAPPVRFRCPPEVVLLTLCRGDWPLPEGQWGVDGRAWARRFRLSITRIRQQVARLIS